MFKNTIVRKPGRSIEKGLTTSHLGTPIYEKALEQHAQYVEVLKSCGVNVVVLEAEEDYPDSCFVEDPAIVTDKCAIITNPGAVTRNGEKTLIEKALRGFYDVIERIDEGTLDGGDVMQVEDTFYVGLSERTNLMGANQLIKILNKYNYIGIIVELDEMFHLKTGVNYIGDQVLLVAGEFIKHPLFDNFKKIIIDSHEMYSANCIRINDYVVMPLGYPKTKEKLIDAGFDVKEVEMSEFKKIDGGLSCLSLRF